ncbi:DUF1573 domain-containing protein [Cryomorphaceae bacterium 1068]|nr:DUF1573 domain-containing protein [Cryomorphaceae bacterium 1068]
MKVKYLIAFFIIGLFASCEESENRAVGTEVIDIPVQEDGSYDEDEIAVINFSEKTIEAGKITQGELITHKFAFTNTGNVPLLISNVDGSCGCTIPRSYPKGKVMPGEGGEIEVEFNSDGKVGFQNVSIIVSANTIPAATQLLIKTDVVVPDNMK